MTSSEPSGPAVIPHPNEIAALIRGGPAVPGGSLEAGGPCHGYGSPRLVMAAL